MMPEKNQHISSKGLFLIFVAALLVRCAFIVILRSWEFPDEWSFGFEMGRLGRSLANGEGFVSTWDNHSLSALFPPIYPLVVGEVFSIFGVYSKAAAVALLLFQSVCSAVAAVCLAVLGSRVLNRTAGIIVGFIFAVYPSSVHYSVARIWYTDLAVMLLLLVMVITVTAEYPPRLRRVALQGGLSGLLVLTDATMSLYLLLLFLWWMFIQKIELSKLVVLGVIWGVTAGVAVSPWMIRNWFVLGFPQLVKSNFGNELFTGNNPFASGMDPVDDKRQGLAALDQEELTYYQSQSEFVYNRYLQSKAIAWIQDHPLAFLTLTTHRVWYFWVRNPRYGLFSWLHLIWYSPFAILALCSLWYLLPRWQDLAPVWLFLLIYPFPFYLTHVGVYRYRYPVEPLVVLLAAIFLTTWFERQSYEAKPLGIIAKSLSQHVTPL